MAIFNFQEVSIIYICHLHTRRNICALIKQAISPHHAGSSLKLVDKFTYLGSSVSSTETDINT